ncbi:serine/threonine-protein phosphatase 4 regulatory subunit 4 isoform X2 [Halyomorpha halys]|uniref:serine/threonine-protein phosphatase 4 regulatory subunit 4 isoform X2 n=1 Tax=Halyomorpha halys TaxID=286706 RepID=UPI0006D4F19A|nr:serine/threonine-protein phosphatase 4 regulatory subunit 4-like isoform X2 [Halyomorpha halys]
MFCFINCFSQELDILKIRLITTNSKIFYKMELKPEEAQPVAIDIATFNLDTPPSALKTNEQIKRHSLDVILESKPVEKALHIFSAGEEVQKLSVVYSIPDIFKEDPTGCLQKLFPKMQQSLPNASTEFHIATSQTVKTIIEKKIIPTDMFVQTFLHTILIGLEHRDQTVADAWLNCLLEVIPFLSHNILSKEVQPIAVQRAALQKPVNVRISACKIIGALSRKYSGAELKRDLLPVILSLCQDVSADVRATICPQLSLAILPIGTEAARTMLLPVIVDLASDESPKVKEIAYTTIVDAVPYFSIETIKNVILPLLKQLCNYAFKFDENVLVAVAASYGKMVVGLERVIAQSDKESYLKSFIALVEKGIIPGKKGPNPSTKSVSGKSEYQGNPGFSNDKLVACRQHCAYNYPALAKFVYSDNNRYLLDMLHRVFTNFIIDPYYLVRRTVACAFHEIIKIYAKYGVLLKPEIINLLKDEVEEVIEGFVPHLGQSLVALVKVGAFETEQQDTSLSELARSLLKCENQLSLSHNWRLYCNFIQQLEVLWFLFPSEVVYNNFVTLLFRRINSCRILPVRLACMQTILVNLRYLQKPAHRNEIRNRILNGDPVPNIRWAVARLLPKLHATVKLPAEKKLSTMIDSVMIQLSNEKDQETLAMLNKSKAQIQKITPVENAADTKKYEEEKRLANLNPKTAQNFPASIVKMLVPSVNGILIDEADLDRQSMVSRSLQKVSRNRPNNAMNTVNPDQVTFTDEDFLVDTGIKMSLSHIGKHDHQKESSHNNGTSAVEAMGPTVIDDATKENSDNLNSNISSEQDNVKNSIRKKFGFRHNIPVRKKVVSATEESLNQKSISMIEKRHSLEVIDANKNINLCQVNEEGATSSTVQRRKKSQLPRPLSCVVLPVRNGSIEKANPPSRLPVMRR